MERNAIGRSLNATNAKAAKTAMGRHMAAIESGNVTKTNVIGLRKAVVSVERQRRGWSSNRITATGDEVDAALAALETKRPIVRGELHESGVKLLTDRRYKRRLESVADRIAELQGFSLIGFYEVNSHAIAFVPVYRAFGNAGCFDFYNVPWQAAMAFGIEGGPHIVGVDL